MIEEQKLGGGGGKKCQLSSHNETVRRHYPVAFFPLDRFSLSLLTHLLGLNQRRHRTVVKRLVPHVRLWYESRDEFTRVLLQPASPNPLVAVLRLGCNGESTLVQSSSSLWSICDDRGKVRRFIFIPPRLDLAYCIHVLYNTSHETTRG